MLCSGAGESSKSLAAPALVVHGGQSSCWAPWEDGAPSPRSCQGSVSQQISEVLMDSETTQLGGT